MPNSVGVPTARSMGTAFGDYGVGLAGGLVYSFVSGLLGSGLLGSLVAPVVAGSVIKGNRGAMISTIAGFSAGENLLNSISARQNNAGRSTRGTM